MHIELTQCVSSVLVLKKLRHRDGSNINAGTSESGYISELLGSNLTLLGSSIDNGSCLMLLVLGQWAFESSHFGRCAYFRHLLAEGPRTKISLKRFGNLRETPQPRAWRDKGVQAFILGKKKDLDLYFNHIWSKQPETVHDGIGFNEHQHRRISNKK